VRDDRDVADGHGIFENAGIGEVFQECSLES
jgi:hypothetical protein